jgi:hypothetical protein
MLQRFHALTLQPRRKLPYGTVRARERMFARFVFGPAARPSRGELGRPLSLDSLKAILQAEEQEIGGSPRAGARSRLRCSLYGGTRSQERLHHLLGSLRGGARGACLAADRSRRLKWCRYAFAPSGYLHLRRNYSRRGEHAEAVAVDGRLAFGAVRCAWRGRHGNEPSSQDQASDTWRHPGHLTSRSGSSRTARAAWTAWI